MRKREKTCCMLKEELWLQIRERQFHLDMKNLLTNCTVQPRDGCLTHVGPTMGTPAPQGPAGGRGPIGQTPLKDVPAPGVGG